MDIFIILVLAAVAAAFAVKKLRQSREKNSVEKLEQPPEEDPASAASPGLTIRCNPSCHVPEARGLVVANPCSAKCTCARPMKLLLAEGAHPRAGQAFVDFVPATDAVWMYSCPSEICVNCLDFPTSTYDLLFVDVNWQPVSVRGFGGTALVSLGRLTWSPKGTAAIIVVPYSLRNRVDHLSSGAVLQMLDSAPAPEQAEGPARRATPSPSQSSAEARPTTGRAEQPEAAAAQAEPKIADPPPASAREGASHRTPWEVLGVEEGATAAELKAAYLLRCKEYHPDKVAALGERLKAVAEEEFKRVQAAYEHAQGRGEEPWRPEVSPVETSVAQSEGPAGAADAGTGASAKLTFQGLAFGETRSQVRRILAGKWEFLETKDDHCDVYLGKLGGEKAQLSALFTLRSGRLHMILLSTFFPKARVRGTIAPMQPRYQQLLAGLQQKYEQGEVRKVFDLESQSAVNMDSCDDFGTDIVELEREWQLPEGSISLTLYHPKIEGGKGDPTVIVSYWHEDLSMTDAAERDAAAYDEL